MSQIIAVLSKIPKLSYHIQQYLPTAKITNIIADNSNSLCILEKAEIIIGDCDLLAQHISKLKSAKWVQSTWAGVESALPQFQKNNAPFLFTRFSDQFFGRSMSEYVVAQIYNHERNQRLQYENQNCAIWNQSGKIHNYRIIQDMKFGILGLGTIGLQIACILKTLGATIWGLKRTVPEEKESYIDEYLTIDGLPKLLENCDYVINLLPTTEQSKYLLNGEVLKNCQQKGTVFMNIGRGSVIKETDLIHALEQNWISAAILDVFEEEPLSSSSKLWSIPQVTITPHMSGVSRAQDVAKFFTSNYLKYTAGEKLTNLVNLQRGY